ncbi:MAG: type I DNA topoisomerase [Sphingobacteriales bacterium]
MAKNLLIVESPAKAKTIEGYLGTDFTVKSSYGHIRDLIKSEDAIDIAHNFEQKYEVPADKKQVVSDLKKLAKEAEMVWLASDEDREGEAISWHLFETLGLKEATTKRIVFHEITKPAIMKAIENPRKIDYNLVNAQQARRVLDRLVGFELSPVLWKKVKPSLSAGRVQSVAVRLIVEREREVNKFTAEAAFKIVAIFGKGKEAFKAELSERWAKQEDAEKFLQDCINADFDVKSLDTRPAKRSPAAPFTTSTLQQEASRKLGYSVSRTMSIAQKLYESGHITYMRTDSVNLSDTALNAAADEIISAYGEKYHQHRKYKTKSAGAQEAHEAIRPTYFNQHTIGGDGSEKRLYELIWKRAIASQMSEAQFEKTTAKISISTRKEELVANGEVMKFDGFLKVYLESNDEEEETDSLTDSEDTILPPLTKGQRLALQEMSATERFSRPPARYTEASLVKKLEELGIGRPSTYAPTISTIQNRGYVVKEEREGKQRAYRVLTLKGENIQKEEKTENTGAEKNKLFPTDIGAVVNDFLVSHFKGIVDFNFTASVEKQFDEIAQGLTEWTKMIRTFYDPFHENVESTIKTADKATGERDLGVHPVSGKKVSVRIGRYGPFVQVGDNATEEEPEKPLYASLRNGQSIETISMEDALELFKLPKKVGIFEDKDMTVAIGKFGPYIRHNSVFVSLPKGIDPLDVTEEGAIELILEKRKKDAEKLIKAFDEDPTVKILNGRWGPYIEFGKQNVKIPKDKQPLDLTFEECKALAAADEKVPKKGGKKFAKKK